MEINELGKLLSLGELYNPELYIRSIIITLYAMILFRTNSARLYGNHSPLDFIIYIILGAILGEAIVNNIPLLPSMISCGLIISIHRILAYLSYKNHTIGKYIKGEKVCIIKNGKCLQKNLRSCQITINDVLQALRLEHGLNEINLVKEAVLERGGQISFILKKSNSPPRQARDDVVESYKKDNN